MFEVTCPSGLRGNLRGMKVKDEQLFTNRKLVKSGQVVGTLLRSCWAETLDPGPYGGEELVWEDVLSADRTYLLVQLRIASYGDSYDFRVSCQSCREHFMWTVDLNKLDVKAVDDKGRSHVQTGQPVPIELRDGRIVHCRLLTGKDEQYLASLGVKDESKILTHHLARRIAEIEGKTHFRDIVKVVEDMEARTADELMDATDDLEGGVDTMFDVECPSCGRTQQIALPFEAGFFSSRKRFARSPMNESG